MIICLCKKTILIYVCLICSIFVINTSYQCCKNVKFLNQVLFRYVLKTSKNQRSSDVFNGPYKWNIGMKCVKDCRNKSKVLPKWKDKECNQFLLQEKCLNRQDETHWLETSFDLQCCSMLKCGIRNRLPLGQPFHAWIGYKRHRILATLI